MKAFYRKHTSMTRLASLASVFLPLFAPAILTAQTTPSMYGSLSNFDVINDTGGETHGFEIELEGVQSGDITYTFGGSYIRYGNPKIVPFAGGVYVRYMSAWNPATKQFVTGTPVAYNATPTTGHSCFNAALGAAYLTSGCEHFGVSLLRNPIHTTYRWLIANPATPGTLTALDPPVAIPAPVWSVVPPAQVGGPVVVAADIEAPVPPRPEYQYGDAQWMKVYKSQVRRNVNLNELLSDNPIVPDDPAHTEVSWDLVQSRVGKGNRNRRRNQGALGGGSHAVIRRYEFFKYTGLYDPLTHEVKCGGDGLCSAPVGGELGDYIGAQMAAANLALPAESNVIVAVVGDGTVSSSVGSIRCPGVCSTTVAPGTAVQLTAKSGRGTFSGWGGSCHGTNLTCSLTANGDVKATATFLSEFTLSISRSGKGTVNTAPAGISCGGSGGCSAKFLEGTVVTLTATVPAGVQFVNWGGACSGTQLTCKVTIAADTQVQANFK